MFIPLCLFLPLLYLLYLASAKLLTWEIANFCYIIVDFSMKTIKDDSQPDVQVGSRILG